MEAGPNSVHSLTFPPLAPGARLFYDACKARQSGDGSAAPGRTRMVSAKFERPVLVSLAAVAVTCVVTQMLVAREFLTVHSGNEIVLGLYLAVWLLLTAAGSWMGAVVAGRRKGLRQAGWLSLLQVVLGLLPALQIAGSRLMASASLRGVTEGFGAALWAGALVLAPFCLLTGFLIPFYVRLLEGQSTDRPGSGARAGAVYLVDCLGSVAGGALFSFVLVVWCTPFETAALLLFVNLAAAALLNLRKPLRLGVVAACTVGAVAAFRADDWDRRTAERQFAGAELLWQRHTAYGHLAATRSGTETTTWFSGEPVATTGSTLAAEEAVHFALAQCDSPRRVLLLSGGVTGVVTEVLKHRPGSVELVEMDPEVLRLVRKTDAAASDPRVTLVAADPRRYVRSSRERYDAVLMDLPAPFSLQANRNFTVEFFRSVRERLEPGGVFSFHLPGSENLVSAANGLVLATAAQSLRAVFPEAVAVPGESVVFLAGDRPFSLDDVPGRLAEKGVPVVSITPEWLAGRLTGERIEALGQTLTMDAEVNRDFTPRGYYAALRYWLERFGAGFGPPAALAAILAAVLVLVLAIGRERIPSAALAASGFAGLGLEVVLLAGFQIVQGSLYRELSLIVTVFLGGAALGAWAALRQRGSASLWFLRLEVLLTVVAYLVAPALSGLHGLTLPASLDWAVPAAFAALNGVVGFLVGAQFQPAVAWLTAGGGSEAAAAGRLYALDVLGACLGAVVVAVFVLPATGLAGACYLLGTLKLTTALAVAVRRRKAVHREVARLEPGAAGVPLIRRPAIAFFTLLAVVAAAGGAIAWEQTAATTLSVSLSTWYHGIALALLGVAFLQSMGVLPETWLASRSMVERWRRHPGLGMWRWIKFLGLGFIVFYPLFRCFFKVPYLFCHVCPRKCVFGWFRPYLIPAALVMNLNNRHWCHHSCPVGTLLHCQETALRPPARRWWTQPVSVLFSLGALAFAAFSYFLVRSDQAERADVPEGWYQFFFKNSFSFSLAVIAVAGVIVLAGVLRRRAFCNCLCPVGSVSEFYLQLERWIKKVIPIRRSRAGTPVPEKGDAVS